MTTAFPPSESRDFTEYKTACPAPEQDQGGAIGGVLPGDKPREYDEWTCLNLTISAPADALDDQDKNLPVMVYVHGGAFKEGGGHVSALHGESPLQTARRDLITGNDAERRVQIQHGW